MVPLRLFSLPILLGISLWTATGVSTHAFLPPGMSEDCVGSLATIAYANGSYDKPKKGAPTREWDKWYFSFQGMASGYYRTWRALSRYPIPLEDPVLDIGPLYNPVFTDKGVMTRFRPWKHVHLWDKDVNALNHHSEPNRYPQHIDFNNLTPEYERAFRDWTNQLLAKNKKKTFSAVTVSQVLNYVDYKVPLRLASAHQATGDLIFISNTVNEGDGAFFSDKRPRSAADVKEYLNSLGYEVIEEEISPGPPRPAESKVPEHFWPGEQFVLVGRKK